MNNLLESKRIIALLLGIVVIALFAIISTWWLLSPKWVAVIDRELPMDSTVAINSYLMEQKIPFKEDSETGRVLVLEADLLEVRKHLNDRGIPTNDSPGLEIFSEAEYGMSEFTQRVNFQRAIESEIAQTLRSFSGVQNARVHLTIPKESIFDDRKAAPKASVTLKLTKDAEFTRQQVAGVKQLVASSVDKLDPENISVLNENGELFYSEETGTDQFYQTNKSTLEKEYALKAKTLIEQFMEDEFFRIAVDIQYNFDKVKSIKEEVIPNKDTGAGFLVSELSKTSSKGKATDKTTSELGSTTEKSYIFTKEKSEIEYAAGKIEKINVGIVISKTVSEAQKQSIVDVVTVGLGLNTDRGDSIVAVITEANKVPLPSSSVIEPVLYQDTLSYSSPETTFTFRSIPKNFLIYAGILLLSLMAICAWITFVLVRPKPTEVEKNLTSGEREELLNNLKLWVGQSNG